MVHLVSPRLRPQPIESIARPIFQTLEPSFDLDVYADYGLAGYVEASSFEPVAFVLRTVLFAQVSAAVGTVLYRQYLAVGAYCAPY